MPGIEREEGLELLDGLVPLALPVVGLAEQEPSARRVHRLGMALDDLLERCARVGVAALVELALAQRVEIGGGKQWLGALLEPIDECRASSEEERDGQEARGNREEIKAHPQGVGFPVGSCTGSSKESQGH